MVILALLRQSVTATVILLLWSGLLVHADQPPVDASTLTGKILAGYQGWYAWPGDGNDPYISWYHWATCDDPGPGCYAIDMWPDVSEYDADELHIASYVTLLDGGTGELFSSRKLKTVERHFKWMKENGIDGISLQRFMTLFGSPTFHHRNRVLECVLDAADTHGRVVILEYDVSGSADTLYDTITRDWQHLVDTYDLTNHPRYLFHKGKPVVSLWGFGLLTSQATPALASQIIDFFRNDPNYGGNLLIGGVHQTWRSQTAWLPIHQNWDVISPWTVGRYNDTASMNAFRTNYVVPDVQECNSLGIEYMPVFWPGFSWDNLKNLAPGTSTIPRNGGQFFWDQAYAFQSVSSNISMMKVAMFDELDESTAIFKMSDNHPETDHWIDNEGLPNDWYMRLTGAATRMLRGEIPLTATFPIDPVYNGDEVSFNLGEDVADRMTHPQAADGNTIADIIDGTSCRRNVNPSPNNYFYFSVDDSFVFQGSQHDLCITVDYYDGSSSGQSLRLQYDSDTGTDLEAIYKNGETVTLGGSNRWMRKIFYVSDAYFGNRQNGGSDFRINCLGGGTHYLDRVLVTSLVPKPPVIQLNKSSIAPVVFKNYSPPDDVFNVFNTGVASLDYNVSGDAGWLSVLPDNGRSTGENDTINISYDTAGLPRGHYVAQITVAAVEAPNSPQTITIDLDVVFRGDFDNDNDLDHEDFGGFQACLSGHGAPLQAGCEAGDFDSDGDVDPTDFIEFDKCVGGPNNPLGC